jgi:hypothetical protein
MTDGKLLSGQQLRPEETLISVGGHAHLHYQGDGNLVVYLDNVPFWASHTDGHTAGSLKMRADGDLVISDASGNGIAHTKTAGHARAMVQLQDDGNFVIYEDPNGPLAGRPIWASSTGKFAIGDVAPEPDFSATVCRRPLVGPLRVQDKLFRDDTGYRRVFFDSDFNLLRKLKYEPSRYYSSLDACVRAGYQGTRQMPSVGGWMDFWAPNYGVYPITFTPWVHSRETGMLRPAGSGPVVQGWPDFDALWRLNLQEHRRRKLRIVVSFGDCQIITADESVEIALHERLARIAKDEGGADVVAGWEIANEYPQNYPFGGSAQSVERQGRVIAAVRRILPNVIFMQGAGLSEEPAVLYESSKYGEACSQHTTRQPSELCIKRTFGLVNWEGDWRHFHKPYWMMEPAGPNVGPRDNQGDDMYAPWEDKAEIMALYGMHAILGMASNFFTGADVRGTEEAEHAWGYNELPKLFEAIFPEDVATWNRVANVAARGIMYFFKDKQFVTATHKSWNPEPPRPIKNWTFYQGDVVRSGTGTPPAGSGIIVGQFT